MSNRLNNGNANFNSLFDIPIIKREPFQQLDVRGVAKAQTNMFDSPDVAVVHHGAHPHTKEQVRIDGGRLSPDVNNTESSTSAQNSVKPK